MTRTFLLFTLFMYATCSPGASLNIRLVSIESCGAGCIRLTATVNNVDPTGHSMVGRASRWIVGITTADQCSSGCGGNPASGGYPSYMFSNLDVNSSPSETAQQIKSKFDRLVPVTGTFTVHVPVSRPVHACLIGTTTQNSWWDACTTFDLSKPPPKPSVCAIDVPDNILDHGIVPIGSVPVVRQTEVRVSCTGPRNAYNLSIRGSAKNGDLNLSGAQSTLSLDGTQMIVSGPGKNYPRGGTQTIILSSKLNLDGSPAGSYSGSATIVLMMQ